MQKLIRRTNNRYIIFIYVVTLWFCFYGISSSIYKNVTQSEPLGYYLGCKSLSYRVGDLVLLCVDDIRYINIMYKLGIERADNECRGNTSYLLKRIIAIPGDTVIISDNGINVGGIHYPHSKFILSYNGINLLPQKPQQIKLKKEEYFVLGNSDTSFDSRYFGVVNGNQIVKKAILIFK